MSPSQAQAGRQPWGFPRVSGDEPCGKMGPTATAPFSRMGGDEPASTSGIAITLVFSPHERG